MRKYMIKRILFSIFSLLVVIMVVMVLVYTLIDRSVVFQTDDTWNKKNSNERTIYEYNKYQDYGYLTYVDYSSFLKKKYQDLYGDDYTNNADYKADKKIIQDPAEFQQNASVKEFVKEYSAKGYKLKYLKPDTTKSGKVKKGGQAFLIAVQEKNVGYRLLDYLKNFVVIETKNMVKDENLTERYIRVEKDPYSGLFAVVGSGTFHKYLLYFDNRFPFIHQNFIRINLGTSYTRFRGSEITRVINTPQGDLITSTTQYPAMVGTDQYVDTAIDFHTVTYNSGEVSEVDLAQFGDRYTNYQYKRSGFSMLENSFVIGIVATIIAYMIGLPAGIMMARRKDKLGDKIGSAYIIFIMAVPSLAYIFMFAAIGTMVFHLPYKFASAEVKFLAYILPTFSLAIRGIGNLMKWMRRFMIDQMNSDYVKFARAEGLSEKEIFNIHISKNAFIPLVHGIPAEILGCLAGAIITERIYAVPGVGNLLTQAINTHDNGIIVACTVFYTSLSIISLILGDLLLAKYDPRISLNADKGGGR